MLVSRWQTLLIVWYKQLPLRNCANAKMNMFLYQQCAPTEMIRLGQDFSYQLLVSLCFGWELPDQDCC